MSQKVLSYGILIIVFAIIASLGSIHGVPTVGYYMGFFVALIIATLTAVAAEINLSQDEQKAVLTKLLIPIGIGFGVGLNLPYFQDPIILMILLLSAATLAWPKATEKNQGENERVKVLAWMSLGLYLGSGITNVPMIESPIHFDTTTVWFT